MLSLWWVYGKWNGFLRTVNPLARATAVHQLSWGQTKIQFPGVHTWHTWFLGKTISQGKGGSGEYTRTGTRDFSLTTDLFINLPAHPSTYLPIFHPLIPANVPAHPPLIHLPTHTPAHLPSSQPLVYLSTPLFICHPIIHADICPSTDRSPLCLSHRMKQVLWVTQYKHSLPTKEASHSACPPGSPSWVTSSSSKDRTSWLH